MKAVFFLSVLLGLMLSCGKTPSGQVSQTPEKTDPSGQVPLQSTANDAKTPPGFSVRAEFTVCQMDSAKIYIRDGFEPVRLMGVEIEKEADQARFRLSGPLELGFYLLGQAPNNVITLILGTEKDVLLSGNCNSLSRFGQVSQSPLNESYNELKNRMVNYERQGSGISARLMEATDPEDIDQLNKEGEQIYQQQLDLLDSVRGFSPFLAKALASQLYVPYDPQYGKNRYIQQMEGFLKEVDLADPELERIPMVYEFIGRLAQMLLAPPQDAEIGESYVDDLLARIPDNSSLKKNALADIIFALDEAGSVSAVKYARLYKTTYRPSARVVEYLNGRIEAFESEMQRAQRLATGSVPPDINLPDPNGKYHRLSNLKGKIVLLDFWASWCGPCRKESPNLVKLYDRYKNRGFEIFGVSLDKSKEAWKKGIADDRISWIQVSDLKHYRSQAAIDYRLNFIPANFLLDKNGKIMAKNLHGKELEAKLAELFN